MFNSAAAALQCAVAIRDGLQDQAIDVRIGIHTGEVETVDGDVRGIAVHAAARIMATAGPSEILTSGVTRAITEGGGFEFENRGRHELKGLPAAVELFALK